MPSDQLTTRRADSRPASSAQRTDPPSDAALVDATAATIAVPRARPADSFVLHAPLELLARAALLPMVEPAGRAAARDRLRSLATAFDGWAPGVEAPTGALASFEHAGAALDALRAALTDGDVDAADAAATWLSLRLDADEIRTTLADPVLPLLSAAAHGSIFLYHLPRVAPRSRDAARMLRSLVRELARHPGWELSWFRDLPVASDGSAAHLAAELADRLARPPCAGDPGSDFIYPMMSLTERSGLAHAQLHDIVADIPLADATRVLLRTAAMSMLQDDPAHAPYGWSHCLTMPQATLGIARACAEPSHAVAVAATYVLAFRSIQGGVALDPAWQPIKPTSTNLVAALGAGPEEAAAAVWHAAPSERALIIARLATSAAAHHDAHLAKYTLACFDAAHVDPAAASLYLAAAAYLGAWWTAVDVAS
jgi:hypothetical protein